MYFTPVFVFIPRSEGGLGIRDPRAAYYAKKLSFYLDTLNSDDPQVRHTARTSLELHMEKRKVDTTKTEQNFAGYATNSKYITKKKSKVNWSKSQWITLNELCAKLNLKLHKEEEKYIMVPERDEETQIVLCDPEGCYTYLKQNLLQRRLEQWREKKSQGRIGRTKNVDHTLSSAHLTNLHLSDSLTKFITKAKLQLIECDSLLHLYYPSAYSKQCKRCAFHTETLSHILNGCKKSKKQIQTRHNRIVNIIASNLSQNNEDKCILVDQVVKQAHFLQESSGRFADIQHSRPDICIIDYANGKCSIVEVATPYDPFLNDCYDSKFQKYIPLCQRIQETGFHCTVIVLVIGSLGSVHDRFCSGLKLLGLNTQRAKAVARYCSVSSMIGSFIVWRVRCKTVLEEAVG